MEGLNLEKVQQELRGAVQFVMNDIRDKFKQINQGPAILDSLKAFTAAVDWSVRSTPLPGRKHIPKIVKLP